MELRDAWQDALFELLAAIDSAIPPKVVPKVE